MAVKRQDGAGGDRKMRADGVRNRGGGGSRRGLWCLLQALSEVKALVARKDVRCMAGRQVYLGVRVISVLGCHRWQNIVSIKCLCSQYGYQREFFFFFFFSE